MGFVHQIAFSPDGKLLATGAWGDNDSAVKIWDVASGEEKQILRGHTDSVMDLAFGPDAKTLASGSMDSTAKLWNVDEGTLIKTFSAQFAVTAVALSANGHRLAVGDGGQIVHIVDLPGKRVAHEYLAHWAGIKSLEFTRDGKTLVSGSRDNSVRFWTVEELPGPFELPEASPRPVSTFNVAPDWTSHAAFSADGSTIAGVCFWRKVSVWNLNEFTCRMRKSFHPGSSHTNHHAALFTKDGKSLVTCLSGNMVPVRLDFWTTSEYQPAGKILVETTSPEERAGSVRVFATDRPARLVVVSSGHRLIAEVDSDSGKRGWSMRSRNGEPECAAVSGDGRTHDDGPRDGTR